MLHIHPTWAAPGKGLLELLDSMLTELSAKHLTHDVLTTFMAEACAIVNNRPIIPVSTDADAPFVLSPSILLTQKTEAPQRFNDAVEYDTKDKRQNGDVSWHYPTCFGYDGGRNT